MNSTVGTRSLKVTKVDSVDRLAVASAACPYFAATVMAIAGEVVTLTDGNSHTTVAGSIIAAAGWAL